MYPHGVGRPRWYREDRSRGNAEHTIAKEHHRFTFQHMYMFGMERVQVWAHLIADAQQH